MASRRGITAVLGLFILVVFCEATQLSRDESREDQRTEFNLASTLTGGISSSRHRQGALLNTNVYPPLGLVGAGGGYTGAAGSVGSSGGIDAAHGHENGGSGVRLARGQPVPAYPPPGFPGQQAPVPYPSAPAYPAGGASYPGVPGGYPATGVPTGYPAMGAPQPPVQLPGSAPAQPGVAVGYYPGYPYPGTYLPQYPAYPQPAQLPAYGVAPGAAVYPPATSTQNVHRYPDHNPQDPSHWDHHFSMNTEYKEDGVHKGAFGVLNNHNAFGYGSGYGGGYNGAFNSPAI
ncbi:calcium-binding protein P isoform X2 [Drosophila bipectinata]|uniref:calcium-binding protein P isoform X2 n=1 Tax=Drosophila bipectinata TaxID=42026 RepID=UPI0038B29BFE